MRTEIKQQAIPEKRAPVQREHLLGIDPRIAPIRRLIALSSLSALNMNEYSLIYKEPLREEEGYTIIQVMPFGRGQSFQ